MEPSFIPLSNIILLWSMMNSAMLPNDGHWNGGKMSEDGALIPEYENQQNTDYCTFTAPWTPIQISNSLGRCPRWRSTGFGCLDTVYANIVRPRRPAASSMRFRSVGKHTVIGQQGVLAAATHSNPFWRPHSNSTCIRRPKEVRIRVK